jgi:hypothetical protein
MYNVDPHTTFHSFLRRDVVLWKLGVVPQAGLEVRKGVD